MTSRALFSLPVDGPDANGEANEARKAYHRQDESILVNVSSKPEVAAGVHGRRPDPHQVVEPPEAQTAERDQLDEPQLPEAEVDLVRAEHAEEHRQRERGDLR